MTQEIKFDPASGILYLPRLALWYGADFGGYSVQNQIRTLVNLLPLDQKQLLISSIVNYQKSLSFQTTSEVVGGASERVSEVVVSDDDQWASPSWDTKDDSFPTIDLAQVKIEYNIYNWTVNDVEEVKK